MIATMDYNNQIIRFSIHGKGPDLTVYTPEKPRLVGDLCLHFDADRLMFSMPGEHAFDGGGICGGDAQQRAGGPAGTRTALLPLVERFITTFAGRDPGGK
jgi:hypothetical protein